MYFIENVLLIFYIFEYGDLAACMDADGDGLVQARELALWPSETGTRAKVGVLLQGQGVLLVSDHPALCGGQPKPQAPPLTHEWRVLLTTVSLYKYTLKLFSQEKNTPRGK